MLRVRAARAIFAPGPFGFVISTIWVANLRIQSRAAAFRGFLVEDAAPGPVGCLPAAPRSTPTADHDDGGAAATLFLGQAIEALFIGLFVETDAP
jgi:hypothetical protein